jgi:hypothetical protein
VEDTAVKVYGALLGYTEPVPSERADGVHSIYTVEQFRRVADVLVGKGFPAIGGMMNPHRPIRSPIMAQTRLIPPEATHIVWLFYDHS